MLKSIGSTWILNALQVAALLVLSPFVLHRLGTDDNGLWVAIVGLTGVLSLLILGVPMASVRFVAERAAKGDAEGVNRAIATCLGMCAVLGTLAACAGGALYLAFDAQYLRGPHAAALSAESVHSARIAFGVVVAQVACGFVMRLPYGVLDAHGDFLARNAVQAGEVVLRFGLTILLLTLDASLEALAIVQIACMASEFAGALAVLRARHPLVRFGLRAFDRELALPVLRFSVWALLLNVGTLLAFRLDAVVIGAFLPIDQATFFDVGNKFFEPLTALVIAVGGVVMPTAARMAALGTLPELRDVFLRWSKVCFSLAIAVLLFLLVLGPEFLGAWMGPQFAGPSGDVLRVLGISFLAYLPVRGVALPILMGAGRPRGPAIALLVTGVVNVALSLALVGPFGIVGVAIGTAVPNVLFAAWVLVQACRALDVSVREWIAHVAGRACFGALAPLAVLAVARVWIEPRSLVALAACGVAMMVAFTLAWVLHVYRDDPHVDLRPILARWRSARLARRTP